MFLSGCLVDRIAVGLAGEALSLKSADEMDYSDFTDGN